MKATLFGIISLLLILFLFSCGSDVEPNVNGTVDKGDYELTINNHTSGETTTLIALEVSTNWDAESGAIWMSTDDILDDQPIGTVTMQIVVDFTRDTALIFPGGLVSKTDRRIGTAMELNPRTFEIVRGSLRNIVVGGNYISAEILDCDLVQVFVPSGQTPETASLTGTFTAVN